MPTPLTSASFQTASAGATNIITSISGESIVVMSYMLGAGAAVLVNFEDEDATALSGQVGVGANVPVAYADHRVPAFTVTKNKSLAVNLSTGVTVGGHITYYSI